MHGMHKYYLIYAHFPELQTQCLRAARYEFIISVYSGSFSENLKVYFTLIYVLIVYILLVNKIIYKLPHLRIKT